METILVADYTGHHLIMLPVQEINLKSCATLTVTQIIQYVWEINRDHSCYLFSSRSSVKPLGQVEWLPILLLKETHLTLSSQWPDSLNGPTYELEVFCINKSTLDSMPPLTHTCLGIKLVKLLRCVSRV